MAEAQTLRFAGTPLVARPKSRRQNERGASPLRGARTYGLTASGPGTVALTTTNNYTGNTFVLQGTAGEHSPHGGCIEGFRKHLGGYDPP